ncbi:MAG: glutathione S-transferase family protein [Pseudomonadota bacterium]
MPETAPEIIFHHYPPSPVSEKVRAGFGLKGLSWRSVEQNRLPERPELFAMTGGYRRIPVMQIGADIYCDTQCILHELEARFPEPSFFPNNGAGLPFAISRWTDGPVFDLAFRVALAPVAGDLPPAFVADRARLYIGADADMEKERADLPHTLAQLRAQIGWLEARLETGRPYILGDVPGMPDLLAWYIVWFINERYAEAKSFFEEFPKLNAWAERMAAIGHGSTAPMTPAEALEIGKESTAITPEALDEGDPQGLKPGMTVTVAPLTDSGEKAIEGRLLASSRDRVAIVNQDPACGETVVHFPRVGYRVTIVDA